jgi:hypothetical protein
MNIIKMNKIYILWATIRPNVFKDMHTKWIERSKNPENLITKVAVNNSIQARLIPDYDIIIVEPKGIGVCEPCWKLCQSIMPEDNDIVVFASDDFLPPQNWDEYLINKLSGRSGGLMVRDGYQLPDSSNMLYPAITIPIITGDFFKKMNRVIYHPSYTHMFSDCELYLNLKEMGGLIDDRLTDETVFEHLHYIRGKRMADDADKAYNIKWKEDEENWNKRKEQPALERIKV